MFQDTKNLLVYGSFTANDNSEIHHHYGLSGLRTLFKASTPEAMHDSAASDYRLLCLEGTREQYIRDITAWGHGGDDHPRPSVMWLNGPAGVGKSAVARSCAERMGERLAATFFFSSLKGPDHGRSEAKKLFTTIAHQLATHSSSYADHLEAKIRHDQSLVSKSLEVQFCELIAGPFRHLMAEGIDLGPTRVIIIDGLDECNSDKAQQEIIRIILASAESLPFRWAIFSRPEPHIESAFLTSDPETKSYWTVTLPVSSDADDDINLYLRNGFRRQGDVAPIVWPSDEEILQLVKKSAGLFIYASTVLKFFTDRELVDREQQPQDLLSLQTQSTKPLSELDIFYTLIMGRVSRDTLPHVLTFLLVSETKGGILSDRKRTVLELSNLLGYRQNGVSAALTKLRSVISLQSSQLYGLEGQDMEITYYHASFLEFLKDPDRSGSFCIFQSPHFAAWARRCFQVIKEVGTDHTIQLSNWNGASNSAEAEALRSSLCRYALVDVTNVCAAADFHKHPDVLGELVNADYRSALSQRTGRNISQILVEEESILKLIGQIPKHSRMRIIHRNRPWPILMLQPLLNLKNTNRFRDIYVEYRLFPVYVLGDRRKYVYLHPHLSGSYSFGGSKVLYEMLLPSKKLSKKSYSIMAVANNLGPVAVDSSFPVLKSP